MSLGAHDRSVTRRIKPVPDAHVMAAITELAEYLQEDDIALAKSLGYDVYLLELGRIKIDFSDQFLAIQTTIHAMRNEKT